MLPRVFIAALAAAALTAAPASAEVPGGWATGGSSAPQASSAAGNGWIDPGTVGGGATVEPPTPPAPSGPRPVVEGSLAAMGQNGLALAPKQAPQRIKLAIWAANQLRRKPYKWGGGHRTWRDSGYDCSGAVSYVLHAAGLLGTPLDSSGFMRYGVKGLGRWISIYANRGHVFMVIAGLRFDTSGLGEKGPRWRPYARSAAGFKVRHPAGL